jgi:hypothetical protein
MMDEQQFKKQTKPRQVLEQNAIIHLQNTKTNNPKSPI